EAAQHLVGFRAEFVDGQVAMGGFAAAGNGLDLVASAGLDAGDGEHVVAVLGVVPRVEFLVAAVDGIGEDEHLGVGHGRAPVLSGAGFGCGRRAAGSVRVQIGPGAVRRDGQVALAVDAAVGGQVGTGGGVVAGVADGRGGG